MSEGSVHRGHRDVQGNRRARARELFERGAFERIAPDVYVVQMPGHAEHTANLAKRTCSHCPDFDFHKQIPEFRCYHLLGAEMYRDWLKGAARDLAPYFWSAA